MTPEQKAALLAKLGGNSVQQVVSTQVLNGHADNAEQPARTSEQSKEASVDTGRVSQSVPTDTAMVAGVNAVNAPLTNAEQIVGRISELQEALAKAAPGYERLLQVIHTALSKDEALTHLLTEEQVGVIVAGLSRKKNVVIAQAAAKSSSKSKQLSKLTAEDL